MKKKYITKFLAIFSISLISHCSFDTKTGIWKNINEINYEKTKQFEGFEILYEKEKKFNQIIKPTSNSQVIIAPPKTNLKWTDIYYRENNNLENFNFKNLGKQIFISSKLNRGKLNDKILFDGENALVTDNKGNIIVYSLTNQQIILKYNFYKKEFKKIEKKLHAYVEDEIIYIGDNLGYLYSINYIKGKVLWAKNYKVPFRSNLKIVGKMLILADENNLIYYINKENGDKIKFIPTEESIIKNDFVSSFAASQKKIFYLNTYGSIYSISNKGYIDWFINLNESLETNSRSLFYSNPILVFEDKLIILTNQNLFILNKNNGSRILKIPISSRLKPIVSGKTIFLITENNLLVSINLETGNILYSLKINDEIANFLETQSKSIFIKTFALINNEIQIFLKNSYVVRFSAKGYIKDIYKLPKKLDSFPIFINDTMIFLNNKNKLVIVG